MVAMSTCARSAASAPESESTWPSRAVSCCSTLRRSATPPLFGEELAQPLGARLRGGEPGVEVDDLPGDVLGPDPAVHELAEPADAVHDAGEPLGRDLEHDVAWAPVARLADSENT